MKFRVILEYKFFNNRCLRRRFPSQFLPVLELEQLELDELDECPTTKMHMSEDCLNLN